MLSKQTTKRNYPIELILIVLCADWSAWQFQEELHSLSYGSFGIREMNISVKIVSGVKRGGIPDTIKMSEAAGQ